jgi:hypothetical protein
MSTLYFVPHVRRNGAGGFHLTVLSKARQSILAARTPFSNADKR